MIDYDDFFCGLTPEEYEEQTREHFEWLKNNATKSKAEIKEWYYITDDEDSHPESFEFVLVEDEFGDKNVAFCDPDYDWYISDGEHAIKLVGKVVKWVHID